MATSYLEDATGSHGRDDRKIHIYSLPRHLSKVTFVEAITEKWLKKGARTYYYKEDGINWATVEFDTVKHRDVFLEQYERTGDNLLFNTKLFLMPYIRGNKFKDEVNHISNSQIEAAPQEPSKPATPPKPARPPSNLVTNGFSFASALKKKNENSSANQTTSTYQQVVSYTNSPSKQQMPQKLEKPAVLEENNGFGGFGGQQYNGDPQYGGSRQYENSDDNVVSCWEELSASTASLQNSESLIDLLLQDYARGSANSSPPLVSSTASNDRPNSETNSMLNGDSSRAVSSCSTTPANRLCSLLKKLQLFIDRELSLALGGSASSSELDTKALAKHVMKVTKYFTRGRHNNGSIALVDAVNFHLAGKVSEKAKSDMVRAFVLYYDKTLLVRVDDEFGGDPAKVEDAARELIADEEQDGETKAKDEGAKAAKAKLKKKDEEVQRLRRKVEMLEIKLARAEEELEEAREENKALIGGGTDSGRSSMVLDGDEPNGGHSRDSQNSSPGLPSTAPAAARSFVKVMNEHEKQICEFRASGNLRRADVTAIFPGVIALKYRGDSLHKICNLVDDGQAFEEPADGWLDRVYTAVVPKGVPVAAAPVLPVVPAPPPGLVVASHAPATPAAVNHATAALAGNHAAAAALAGNPATAALAGNPISATSQYQAQQAVMMAQYMARIQALNGQPMRF